MIIRNLTIVLTAFLSLLTGCRHCCLRPNGCCLQPTSTVPGAVAVPGNAPVPFPPSASAPPAPVIKPAPAPMSPGITPQQSYLSPAAPTVPNPAWQAPKKQIALGSPEPMSPAGPDGIGDSPATPPTKIKGQTNDEPPLSTPTPKKPPSPFPVGIPQFAVALPGGVTSGLRPMLDGGLDWLESHGYKTVLHVKSPNQPDDADRKQVEKRGMEYVSLDLSPELLTASIVEEFGRIVSDPQRFPLFVYDQDGSLAGGLWYLYFREIEQLSDEVARVRAGSLGLRIEGTGPHQEMWLAIQKYLSEKGT